MRVFYFNPSCLFKYTAILNYFLWSGGDTVLILFSKDKSLDSMKQPLLFHATQSGPVFLSFPSCLFKYTAILNYFLWSGGDTVLILFSKDKSLDSMKQPLLFHATQSGPVFLSFHRVSLGLYICSFM